MMRLRFAGFALLACAATAQAQPGTLPASTLYDYPHKVISNGILTAKVFLPGEKGMYRGTRFDHAGVVTNLTYKGQDYSTWWFDRVVADAADRTARTGTALQTGCCAITGPVEEFDPIGFDDAGMGGRFLKIGVGILKRDTEAYSSFPTYPILDAGKRATHITKSGAHFTQVLQDRETGYGYDYAKTVTLTPGKPQMTIAHVLKNTGRKPLNATVFNHNFLTLDPGNANMVLTAPFDLKNEKPLQPELARVEGKTLRYLAKVPEGVSVNSPFSGFGPSASDYDFRVLNTVTGFGQRMRADVPLAKINMWSVPTTFSWEPYITIALKPGETQRWTFTYDLFGPGEK